jgi:hypothetical protein
MDREHCSGHEACKPRVDLWRELAHSLEQAHAAVVRSDLPEIRRQTACQQELCVKLRQLPVEPGRVQAQGLHGGLPPPVADCGDVLRGELAEVERRVAHLNRRYEALLRRARRTVDIFCRVLANSALTYPPPRAEAATFAAGFQE